MEGKPQTCQRLNGRTPRITFDKIDCRELMPARTVVRRCDAHVRTMRTMCLRMLCQGGRGGAELCV